MNDIELKKNDPLTSNKNILHIKIHGRNWMIDRPGNLEDLWNQIDTLDEDERIPYWTEIWPSSIILGEWLHSNSKMLNGKYTLDLGCGLGLTALIGTSLGANVIGVDYELNALKFACKNATLNSIAQPCWVQMDWRYPAVKKHSIQIIWAGDIIYELRSAIPIIQFLKHSLTPNGVAWIAEPCRSVYKTLLNEAIDAGLTYKCVFESVLDPNITHTTPITIRIWQFQFSKD